MNYTIFKSKRAREQEPEKEPLNLIEREKARIEMDCQSITEQERKREQESKRARARSHPESKRATQSRFFKRDKPESQSQRKTAIKPYFKFKIVGFFRARVYFNHHRLKRELGLSHNKRKNSYKRRLKKQK